MATPDAMIDIVQIQLSWLDRWTLALASALLGAFFAYVNNKIQQKNNAKTDTIKNLSEEFLHQLDIIDSLIKDYWSVARIDMGKGKEMILSSSIYIAFPRLERTLNLIFKLKLERHPFQRKDLFQRTIDEIYEYATADIDVEPRDVSQPAIMKTSRAILRLRFQEFIYQ